MRERQARASHTVRGTGCMRMSRRRKRERRDSLERRAYVSDLADRVATDCRAVGRESTVSGWAAFFALSNFPSYGLAQAFHPQEQLSFSQTGQSGFIDPSAYFSYMRSVRERVDSYHQAIADIRSAAARLRQAEDHLREVRAGHGEAVQSLQAAGRDLQEAQELLAQVSDIMSARQEDKDTREEPEKFAAPGETQPDRETELREQAAEEQAQLMVGQARVEAMLFAALMDEGKGADSEGGDYRRDLDETLSELARNKDSLRSLRDEFIAMEEQAAGSGPELSGRQLALQAQMSEKVRKIEEGMAASRQSLSYLEQSEDEAAVAYAEADAGLEQAEAALERFGEGNYSIWGTEYYAWSGAADGYQCFTPYEFRHADKNWEYGLSSGYISSYSGLPRGSYSGFADTELSLAWRNVHARNEWRCLLGVNVPTGDAGAHPNAWLTDDLARFTTFGEGWNFVPGVELVHRMSERDSLTGRLRYAFRNSYDCREPLFGNPEDPGTVTDTVETSMRPGNLLLTELEYMHAGESRQFLAQLAYKRSGKSALGNAGYRPGDEWDLRLFYNRDVSPEDSLQTYFAYLHKGDTYFQDDFWQDARDSGVSRRVYGLGWSHRFSSSHRLSLMASYLDADGSLYDPGRMMEIGSRTKKSLRLGYDIALRDPSLDISLAAEKYWLDAGDEGYRGWNCFLKLRADF